MTRREIIVFAAQSGIPPFWIAFELGTTANNIKVMLSKVRAKGRDIPHFSSPASHEVRRANCLPRKKPSNSQPQSVVDAIVRDWNRTKLTADQIAAKHGVSRGVAQGIIQRDPRSKPRRIFAPVFAHSRHNDRKAA